MSKVNLKDNIWIEGFINDERVYQSKLLDLKFNEIYSGKTSEISEDIAKECVEVRELTDTKYLCVDYSGGICCITAKESIQSACPEEYCVIYKQS